MLFFSLSLIFVLHSINFQRNSSIYFSVRFDPYFFLLLSVLFEIIHKIRFFLISLLFKFFHLLDLVLILFITICFVFNLFLNWYLFFKCILQHFISFISYVNFYPYSFNFYFFCFKFFLLKLSFSISSFNILLIRIFLIEISFIIFCVFLV
jgi:hypothetical protein